MGTCDLPVSAGTAEHPDVLLERLISAHGDKLLRYCHSILLDYHEAQDVVQATFIKAYAKVSARNAGATHGAWLYRAAYTGCMDILRRKKIQRLFFGEKAEEGVYTQEYFISDSVKQTLLQLSPKDRALVFSRAVEGYDFSDLETVYGVSAQTLRKRYERARRKLAKIILEEGFS